MDFAKGSTSVENDTVPSPGRNLACATDWDFVLEAAPEPLFAHGFAERLTPGPASTLAARVRAYFADRKHGLGLLVGALPFDRNGDDFLFEPLTLGDRPTPAALDLPLMALSPEPDAALFRQSVQRALDELAVGQASKVVLSRSLVLNAQAQLDPLSIMSRMAADPGAMRFLTPIGRDSDGGMRRLTGASPELLVAKSGDVVVSHPLAGSARRHSGAADDRQAAEQLKASAKDLREHAVVVEAILDGLAPYCRDLSAPRTPDLAATRSMWHLGTRIEGRLREPDAVSSAELAAVLHPTPAVGGAPRAEALEMIERLEGYDRGFYAGAVGWTDRRGDGVWCVALRCAEISGRRARLYAGAGIVEGSDPQAETDETSAKFQAMLSALGIDESGRLQDSGA